MKTLYKYILAAAIGSCSLTSCLDDLNQVPVIETTPSKVYTSVAGYKSVLAKLYASFVIAGQEEGGGNADLSSNSGHDYMRIFFNLQEVPTEEIAYTWLEGNSMTGMAYMKWDANDIWVSDMYYRIYYTIALCNEFLRNASDEKIASFPSQEQDELKTFRAEARFLRALAYSHALDFYGNVPFVDENDPVGAYIPPCYKRADLFDFVINELTDIEEQLSDRATCEYARAGKGAAWTLLARLYLNGEVYSGKPFNTECIAYCNKIIQAGYSLEPQYARLFNADNHKRTNEIIFPLAIDGVNTVSWGATTLIVCGAISGNSTQKPADYGCETAWSMFRVRPELPALFGDHENTGDGRFMFYTDGQAATLDKMDDQSQGYMVEKWTNLTDAGEAASPTSSKGVSTDFPLFRLGDVYLMYAEAVVRGGAGGSKSEALRLVNLLRERAYGNQTGAIGENELTLDFLLDERGRELYWECVRRTDLIRFGKFTGDSYTWHWKGGVKEGISTDAKYNIYPIPTSELSANPNMKNEFY
ncbi:MAG: RagB/SusD family nutrient uptake outer membrane protein [Bacteroidales bacterium]